jgi:hypothetical protein
MLAWTYCPWLLRQIWVHVRYLFAAVELEAIRRIGPRARQWRVGDKQNLALDNVAQVCNLSLCVLAVDRHEGNAEAVANVLDDAIVGLKRIDLEVSDHGLRRFVKKLNRDRHVVGVRKWIRQSSGLCGRSWARG